jgi:hypothetical protein
MIPDNQVLLSLLIVNTLMDAISFLAFYDLWKSAEMAHAPHTPLKNRFKEWVAPKLGLAIPQKQTGDQNAGYPISYSGADLVHTTAMDQIAGIKAPFALA